jgi:site-specific DNA-methyltransferase (adenine-specific)
MPTYSTGELAWISWQKKIDFVDIAWHGMIQSNMKDKEDRIHPTQKPVALYKWLLKNYATPDMKIFDSHLGSGSSAIAAWEFKCAEFIGCDIDKDYFDAAVLRFENHIKQLKLF